MKKLLLCLVIAGISLFTGCGDKENQEKGQTNASKTNANADGQQKKKTMKQNEREGTEHKVDS